MGWARAEIQALLLRAGRGAGLPLSHAEDLSIAVAEHGDNAALEAAATALADGWTPARFEQKDELGIAFKDARALSALPVAIDALAARVPKVELRDLDAPELVAPFLAAASARVGVDARHSDKTWVLTGGNPSAQSPKRDRFNPPQSVIDTLSELAARTYVPASSASRDGAGAGTIDND
ncbi:MAG: hypothetical protein AAGI10_07195 [Pseudomonadota bacterium]